MEVYSTNSECKIAHLRCPPHAMFNAERNFSMEGSAACRNEEKLIGDGISTRILKDPHTKILKRCNTCPSQVCNQFTFSIDMPAEKVKQKSEMPQLISKTDRTDQLMTLPDAPVMIVVDESTDDSGSSGTHEIVPAQNALDPNFLAPPLEDSDNTDTLSELDVPPVVYRCKPNMFTFDHITEEECEDKEGSITPTAKLFSSLKLKEALDNDKKTSDLVKLKAMTARLNLTTRRQSYITWKEEYLDKPLLAKYMPQMRNNENTEWSDERKEEINNAIKWLRRELIEMKKNDQELARVLVTLRHEIRQMKLERTCDQHREMLDDLEDQMAERGQMSELCDLPTEPMSPAPLKNVGVTRMNISSRRFSVF